MKTYLSSSQYNMLDLQLILYDDYRSKSIDKI